MDIIQERLEREYDLNLIATAPSVSYEIKLHDKSIVKIENPSKLPVSNEYTDIFEPWVSINIITPSKFIGVIMDLVINKRGEYKRMEYLESKSVETSDGRVVIDYEMPLSEILIDFHDKLKSGTQGYASMDYNLIEPRSSNLVKVDILVNHENVDALSMIAHKDKASILGKSLVEKLQELIPRQMFPIPIQAAIGGKILARTNVKALRKNVLAKCYGGDVTRKRKLLEQQKKGKKKRMKMIGSIEIPQDAFMAVLKLD